VVGSELILEKQNERTVGREMGAGDWGERGNRRGIGARVGGRGANLVLTARRKERLERLAQELSAAHKIRVESSPRIWRKPPRHNKSLPSRIRNRSR